MADKDDDFKSMKERCERAEAELADYKKRNKKKNERDEGDEDDDEKKKDKNSATDGKDDEMPDREKDKNSRRIAELEAENRMLRTDVATRAERELRETFGRAVDGLAKEGFQIGEDRDAMVDELATSADPDAKMEFWKRRLARNPVGIQFGGLQHPPQAAETDPTKQTFRRRDGSLDSEAITAEAVRISLTKPEPERAQVFRETFAKLTAQAQGKIHG